MARKLSLNIRTFISLLFLSCLLFCCAGKSADKVSKTNPPNPPSDVEVAFSLKPSTPLVAVSFKDNSDDEEGFRIEGRESEGSSYETIAKLPPGTTLFDDAETPIDKSYYYRVDAFNDKGTSSSQWDGMRLGFYSSIEAKNIRDFAVNGAYLYILSLKGLTSYDISNPKAPVELSTLELKNYVKAGFIAVSQGRACIADDDRLFLVNIEDPANLMVMAQTDIGFIPLDIALNGNAVYLLSDLPSLLVVNIDGNKELKKVKSLALDGSPRNLALLKNHLFIASSRSGIQAFDVRAEANPKLANRYSPEPERFYNTVGAWGDKLIATVRDFENELQLFSVSENGQISFEGKFRLNWIPLTTSTLRGFVFVPESEAGLEIILVKDPLRMRKVASIRSEVDKVRAYDNVVVLSYQSSLYILSVP